MDDISKKREQLMLAYPHRRWQQKVIRMSEAQVIAVYLRLKAQGKI